jgi:hypothetical protein
MSRLNSISRLNPLATENGTRSGHAADHIGDFLRTALYNVGYIRFHIHRRQVYVIVPVHRVYDVDLVQAEDNSVAESGELLQILLVETRGSIACSRKPQDDITVRAPLKVLRDVYRIRLWDTNTIRVAAYICSVEGDGITRTEWGKYLPSLPYNPPCKSS